MSVTEKTVFERTKEQQDRALHQAEFMMREWESKFLAASALLNSVMELTEKAKQGSKSYELVSAINEVPGLSTWLKNYRREEAKRQAAIKAEQLAEIEALEAQQTKLTTRLNELRARHGKAPFTAKPRTRSTAVNKEEPVHQQRARRKAVVATSATEEKTKQYAAKAARNKKPEAVSTTTQNAKRGRPRKTATTTARNANGKGK